MTACLLYAKIHKNKAENLLHLMLYFSNGAGNCKNRVQTARWCVILIEISPQAEQRRNDYGTASEDP